MEAALKTVAVKDTCSQCGKRGAALKLCSRCKQASYCGAECQTKGWKVHKKTCAPPVPLHDVCERVRVAHNAANWRGVLKWEGRMEELVEAQTDDKGRDAVLSSFMRAHMMLNEGEERVLQIESRRVDLLGKMERFRDQGRALCHLGHCHTTQGREDEAARCFQRGRDLGAAHGFFSLECKACEGLGILAMKEGRHQEGVDLLRNALAAAPLNEYDDTSYELTIFRSLVNALFTAASASPSSPFSANARDEVEEVIPRYRKAAEAESKRSGKLCSAELDSLQASAHLHKAHGHPEKAAQDLHALLTLARENKAAVLEMPRRGQRKRLAAHLALQKLDMESGEEREEYEALMVEMGK